MKINKILFVLLLYCIVDQLFSTSFSRTISTKKSHKSQHKRRPMTCTVRRHSMKYILILLKQSHFLYPFNLLHRLESWDSSNDTYSTNSSVTEKHPHSGTDVFLIRDERISSKCLVIFLQHLNIRSAGTYWPLSKLKADLSSTSRTQNNTIIIIIVSCMTWW